MTEAERRAEIAKIKELPVGVRNLNDGSKGMAIESSEEKDRHARRLRDKGGPIGRTIGRSSPY